MKMMILSISLLFSQFLLANEFTIDSAFGLHKGMTKNELDKTIKNFRKLPDLPNYYCTTYNSNYAPTKGNFDYYIYTFYKDTDLVGVTGVKQNANNDFFTQLLAVVKDKYGNETKTNKDYPLESYHYYYWNIEKPNLNSISINNFFKKNKVMLDYFFTVAGTCSKK